MSGGIPKPNTSRRKSVLSAAGQNAKNGCCHTMTALNLIVLKNAKVGGRQESSGRDFERRSKFDVSLNSLR